MHCLDLLELTPRWLRYAYPRIYETFVRRFPHSWAMSYYALDAPVVFQVCQWWRRRWNWWMAAKFRRWLQRHPTDVVVSTHFFPADVCGAMKRAGRLQARLVVVITDLFPHRLWLAPEADAFVVASEPTREICRMRRIPDAKLHLLGIPIEAKFRQARDRAAVCRDLGLDPSRRTVLIASGGMGVGPIKEVVEELLANEAIERCGMQLLVICGGNEALRRELQALADRISIMPVRVFGFVETMHECMQVSELLVTKAGGLTVMEALAVGLPMVFIGTIPGQEQLNAEYTISRGAAVQMDTPEDVAGTVFRLFKDSLGELEQMRARARSLSRPAAADAIVTQLVCHGAVTGS